MAPASVLEALGADWPTGKPVDAELCAYREFADPAFGEAIDLLFILDGDDWTESHTEACMALKTLARERLQGHDVEVFTSCRILPEHLRLDGLPGEDAWVKLADGSACPAVAAGS